MHFLERKLLLMLHEDLSNYNYSDTLVRFSDLNAMHNSGYNTITL